MKLGHQQATEKEAYHAERDGKEALELVRGVGKSPLRR